MLKSIYKFIKQNISNYYLYLLIILGVLNLLIYNIMFSGGYDMYLIDIIFSKNLLIGVIAFSIAIIMEKILNKTVTI